MSYRNAVPFNSLTGKILDKVEVISRGGYEDDVIIFHCNDGEIFEMYHDQDCCEDVGLNDVNGEWEDLIGLPILLAEESFSSDEDPLGVEIRNPEWRESFTWSFYKLATVKGYVNLRWYGESNGYYSERVTLHKIFTEEK